MTRAHTPAAALLAALLGLSLLLSGCAPAAEPPGTKAAPEADEGFRGWMGVRISGVRAGPRRPGRRRCA